MTKTRAGLTEYLAAGLHRAVHGAEDEEPCHVCERYAGCVTPLVVRFVADWLDVHLEWDEESALGQWCKEMGATMPDVPLPDETEAE